MSKAIALAVSATRQREDIARIVIVLASAAALIFAGPVLPF
jgi:hypothetical protein